MFLQSCSPASVLPDNKVAITEQSQEGVIYALQSRLTLPGEGPRGARPPSLILDQNEARRAEKTFFFEAAPLLTQGLDDRPALI